MRKLSCFVASAFDKTDVDKIYKNGIHPTLKSMDIKCRRVDKEEHNDDIDDKIIELIHKCDFCIADLTYARPSVYYESGFFSGLGKNVIYIARRDHFLHDKIDIHGNKRVHFDLQMKNIIPWNNPEQLAKFIQKLKSRINLITRPLLQKHEDKEKLTEEREKFERISSNMKCRTLTDFIKDKMIQSKWVIVKSDFSSTWLPKNYLCFLKGKHICVIFVTASMTKNEFKFVDAHRIAYQNKEYIKKTGGICHVVIISYRKIPDSRIENIYPSISKIPGSRFSYFGGNFSDWMMRDLKNDRSYYHFVSDIKSESEFKDLIEELFREIETI